MNNTNSLSSLICSSAEDVIRGLFKPSEYGRVILPFVVMRRLDCVLEPKKDEVYRLYESYKDKLSDPSPVIRKEVGLLFFNYSKYDLTRINFNNCIQRYSAKVLDIIEKISDVTVWSIQNLIYSACQKRHFSVDSLRSATLEKSISK